MKDNRLIIFAIISVILLMIFGLTAYKMSKESPDNSCNCGCCSSENHAAEYYLLF